MDSAHSYPTLLTLKMAVKSLKASTQTFFFFFIIIKFTLTVQIRLPRCSGQWRRINNAHAADFLPLSWHVEYFGSVNARCPSAEPPQSTAWTDTLTKAWTCLVFFWMLNGIYRNSLLTPHVCNVLCCTKTPEPPGAVHHSKGKKNFSNMLHLHCSVQLTAGGFSKITLSTWEIATC